MRPMSCPGCVVVRPGTGQVDAQIGFAEIVFVQSSEVRDTFLATAAFSAAESCAPLKSASAYSPCANFRTSSTKPSRRRAGRLEGQRLGAGPASDRRRPLVDLDREAGPGQRQRGGQAVGPRAHHDGVRTLHGPTLPAATGGHTGARPARTGARGRGSIGCAAPAASPRTHVTRHADVRHEKGAPWQRCTEPASRASNAVRTTLADQLETGRRPRRLGRRLPPRRAGRRHLGRLGRRRTRPGPGSATPSPTSGRPPRR